MNDPIQVTIQFVSLKWRAEWSVDDETKVLEARHRASLMILVDRALRGREYEIEELALPKAASGA